MSGRKTSRSKHIDFIILDLICVELSFYLAYILRFGMKLKDMPYYYQWINMITVLAHLSIVFFTEGYSGIVVRGYLKEFKRVTLHNAYVFAIVIGALFANKNSIMYSRIFMGVFLTINILLMYCVRCIRKTNLRRHKNDPKGKGCMLIIADFDYAVQLVELIQGMPYKSYMLEGVVVCDRDMVGKEILGIKVVANKDNMFDYVLSNVIDDVLIVNSEKTLPDMIKRFTAMGITVHVGVNALLPRMQNLVVENIGNYTVLTTSNSVVSFKQKIIKRLMDIAASIVGIILMCILFVIFAPIICIQSPGPIFFKQIRVGKNGRFFKIYKFRSMYMDAEERKKELESQNKMQGHMFKMDDDPRVTPIGRFMRRTSIDEFPQFINILKGDMSLVGTRPPTVEEYEMYSEHHKSRLAMKPGLTGMWQVSGRSEITDFEEIVRLDNEYITNFSISMDIKIIFKTIGAVIKRKGSS